MKISLSKNSDVPLWQQLAEQIVFLIATGQLLTGQQLPSVRALARRVKVHHNTVSEAYKDLVRRNWLTRQHGSRLTVGTGPTPGQKSPSSLDELINESVSNVLNRWATPFGRSLNAYASASWPNRQTTFWS
jgi:DNA-binding transcriptional regulator YhcF (GntR family)